MQLIHDPTQQEEVLLSGDELKLLTKYREMVEKLKPGSHFVTRVWSFPLIESSGDAIYCSLEVRFKSEAPSMDETQVKIHRSREKKDD
jgi:hypothetical protein